MIASMTAFARREHNVSVGTFVWEIRSVNQRFLEPSFRLPETLRGLEFAFRERIRHQLTRGKLDCSLRYEPSPDAAVPSLNEALVMQLQQLSQRLGAMGLPGSMTQTDILRWPGVMQTKESDVEMIEAEAQATFDAALGELIAMRRGEGLALKQLLLDRLDGIEKEVAKARVALPEVIEKQREKLLARFAEAKVDLDPQRLEQEMVLFAQRLDTAEEMDRLSTHVIEIRRLLQEGGAIGRRLDFLVQELHREANTLGAKSVSTTTTACSVSLKVLIEQMREQVQNIE